MLDSLVYNAPSMIETPLTFGIFSNIASILGFFVSIAAWWNADAAKRAARDARKAVRLANAAEVFNELSIRATELISFVEAEDSSAAKLRGRDLVSALVRARVRYERFMSQDSKTAMAEA